jgi:RNA polymerase sigma-70 factor (ECF subfamily)
MAESSSSSAPHSLLEQVRQRNESAWRQLSQIFAPGVYRWCRNAGLQPSDAADVVQEVFLAVSENIDRFRRDRAGDTFRGWLWTIFRSKLMDHFRRRDMKPPEDDGVDPRTIPATDPSSTSLGATDLDAAAMVRRALKIIEKDFSHRTWQAFWRSAVLEERTSEVAQELEITAAAVCMCRSRVLQRLRETLADLDILPSEQLP